MLRRLNRLAKYNAPAVLLYAIAAVCIALATAVVWPLATYWWRRVDGLHPVLEGLAVGGLGFATYVVWGLVLLTVIAVLRNLIRVKTPEGRFRLRSWAMAQFFVYNTFFMVARYLFLPLTRTTRFNILFYRAMGATIGKGCVINTPQVYDVNLLELGDDVTIGGSAVVMAHAGQGDEMYMAPVTIHDGASLGEGAIVFPGATIGEDAVVGAGSVVPADATVPAGETVTGVPIEGSKADRVGV